MEKNEFTAEQYVQMATERLNKGQWRRALAYLQNAQKLNPSPLD